MPGPGKRKTGKSKKAGGSGAGRDLSNVDISTVLDSYIDEINDTEGWETVVRFLCRMFDLPDLETRSGLKKIHNNFPQIQKNLQAAYTKYEGNAKITGGIAGIWARMSIDVILRDRLFREGLISKMIPLLDVRATRYVGLQALSTVTHHGGVEVRHEIAKYTSTLLRLMEEFPDDSAVNDLVIVTLAHAVGSVITDDNVQAHTIRELDMPTVLRLTMVNIRKPDAPHYMLSHALQLLSCSTLHCYREVKAIPSLVKLLVASLRSADLTVRCSSLGGLVRLFHNECERDLHVKDPQKFMAAIQRGFPDNLSDLLMAHDPTKCDTYVILQTSADYQKAMMRCVQDHDLYALGKTLAGLILKTEFAIAEGGFQAYNERTGQPEIMDVGLPFKMWSDSLPICAKAVRAKGTPKDLDMADILDIKFFIMRQRIPEAADLAKRAIERSPQVAYFYYAISLAAELTQGLRAAKKGLKCKQITPFVRANLLWRCVCHAGDLGLTRLQMAAPGDTAYSEGIAFLVSALDDAKTFTSEIPPDSRHHINILNWLILLTIALRGSELSPDLRELDDAFKKLDIARQFYEFFGIRQYKTELRLTRELVVSQYSSAVQEWGPFVRRFDSLGSDPEKAQDQGASKAEDNLAAWLEGMHVDDGQGCHTKCSHPKLTTKSVELYRCSHCGNPSAILRKCGGCAKTRYCDSSCQKLHWTEHKVACKAAQSQI